MSISQADAAFVRTLVHQKAAIKLDADKDYLIETRLAELVQTRAIGGGISELVKRARNGDSDLNTKIIEAIATHETLFFRDVAPFRALERLVLPPLIAARKDKTLTIWSAACSSGQEPYSIAMLLRDRFPELLTWQLKIIATDLSAPIIARAKEASYGQLEVNRGLPAAYLAKYFRRDGTRWRVCDDVRKMVEFRIVNLIDNWSIFPRPDVVFMRNVLIYFDQPTKRRILDNVRATLAPDGALFLGAAETTLNVCEGWDRDASGEETFHRVRR